LTDFCPNAKDYKLRTKKFGASGATAMHTSTKFLVALIAVTFSVDCGQLHDLALL